MKPKKNPIVVAAAIDSEMHKKVLRMAKAEYCSVSTILRKLIAAAPEPKAEKRQATGS